MNKSTDHLHIRTGEIYVNWFYSDLYVFKAHSGISFSQRHKTQSNKILKKTFQVLNFMALRLCVKLAVSPPVMNALEINERIGKKSKQKKLCFTTYNPKLTLFFKRNN
jgi:hypothetical protein